MVRPGGWVEAPGRLAEGNASGITPNSAPIVLRDITAAAIPGGSLVPDAFNNRRARRGRNKRKRIGGPPREEGARPANEGRRPGTKSSAAIGHGPITKIFRRIFSAIFSPLREN